MPAPPVDSVVIQADEGARWLAFAEPVAVLSTGELDAVRQTLAAVAVAVEEQGLHAAGFIAYEAAPAFDAALQVRQPAGLPLVWFGLYRDPAVAAQPPAAADSGFELGRWRNALSGDGYGRAIAAIKDHIARGDTYQVNFTFPMRAEFRGEPWALFTRLAAVQRANYAAFVDTGRFAICSASPELFFLLDGERVMSRPMKGTAPRGRTLAQDLRQRAWLRASEKNRAENVMIVDMIRNDLGRVARFDSVRVPRLFDVEVYPTVLQMTSTVEARTNAPLDELVAALFPCASITGAPKVRTMEIIRELEEEPRGVYCGAVGYLAPGRRAQFNVAIRTVVVDREEGQASYGVGGGIVWDSDAGDEFRECQLKARVLTAQPPSFHLLETLRWTAGEGFFLLERHLQRLADSATYFGIPLNVADLRRRLEAFAAELPRPAGRRVRVLVSQEGACAIESTALDLAPREALLRVGLATAPVDSSDVFLYHKTTRRMVYDQARASRPDCDDVLLWNERGELTESSIANLVLELDGTLVTPPIESGLLAGTFRGMLLDTGVLQEGVITLADLARCQRLCLINSVRGWQDVILVDAQ